MYDPASDEPKAPAAPERRTPLLLAAVGVLAVAAGAGVERALLQQKQAAARPLTPPPAAVVPGREAEPGAAASSPAEDRILAKASPDQKLDVGLPAPPPAEVEPLRASGSGGARQRISLGQVDWEFQVPEGYQPAAPDWGEGAAQRGWRPDDGWVKTGTKGGVRLRLHAYFTEFLCRPYDPLTPPQQGLQNGYRTLRYQGKGDEEGFVLFVNPGTCVRLSLRADSPQALQEALPAFLEAQRSLGPAGRE